MKLILKISSIILFPFIVGLSIQADKPEPSVSEPFSYPEHIAGAYTGGFGEDSCHSCHFDYDLNPGDGSLEIIAPDLYRPGEPHEIEINVQREDIGKAGFQMTARFENGSQAGRFELNDKLTETPGIDNELQYIQHGIGEVTAEGGSKTWAVIWNAPEEKTGPVYLNIAVNAANGDDSEFGDWIYVDELVLNE